jgi:hypothetical protein
MQAVQAGESGLQAFSKAFPGLDPHELQSDFLDFVREWGAK